MNKKENILYRCVRVQESLTESMRHFLWSTEQEERETNDGIRPKCMSNFGKGEEILETTQTLIKETISVVKKTGVPEITDEASVFGASFHTVLRKYFNSNSSCFLYETISEETFQWISFLREISSLCEENEKEFGDLNLSQVYRCFDHVALTECWKLKIAFHYFILEHDEIKESPFRDIADMLG